MTRETINEVLKFRDDRNWKQFHNPAIRRIASTKKHMTMKEIRERAEEFVAMMEREGYYNG